MSVQLPFCNASSGVNDKTILSFCCMLSFQMKCCPKAKEDRPDDCIPIPVPRDDPFWSDKRGLNRTCMELRRAMAVDQEQCGTDSRFYLLDFVIASCYVVNTFRTLKNEKMATFELKKTNNISCSTTSANSENKRITTD